MTIRSCYLDTAALAVRTLADPAVRDRWDQPSSLPQMSVGELAAHLSRSVLQVADFLGQDDPRSPEPVAAQAYYGDLAQLTDPGSALNAGVRQRSRESAAAGPDAVAERARQTLDALAERLPSEPADRQVLAFGAQPMLLDDYLRTRLVEFAVHLDDLAVLVPDDALTEAVAVLVGAARHRHGDLAVLRALARRERDRAHALRVL
jgi:hypothetical protein